MIIDSNCISSPYPYSRPIPPSVSLLSSLLPSDVFFRQILYLDTLRTFVAYLNHIVRSLSWPRSFKMASGKLLRVNIWTEGLKDESSRHVSINLVPPVVGQPYGTQDIPVLVATTRAIAEWAITLIPPASRLPGRREISERFGESSPPFIDGRNSE